MSALEIGVSLNFNGKGIDEVAVVSSVDSNLAPNLSKGDVIVRVDPKYFRPAEVETLLGDPSKAKNVLGWVPEISVQEMCSEMMAHDLNQAKQKSLLKSYGYNITMTKET